jgi:hypothetical protein
MHGAAPQAACQALQGETSAAIGREAMRRLNSLEERALETAACPVWSLCINMRRTQRRRSSHGALPSRQGIGSGASGAYSSPSP